MEVLVINSGSSSIKFKLFDMPEEKVICKGMIEKIGEEGSLIPDHYTGLKMALDRMRSVHIVGHRVVHGAEKFKKPVIIDTQVIRKIKQCCSIAPLHNPANLAGILAAKKLLPHVKQVAVFDTAFHQTLPDYAYVYGLPYEYYQKFRIRKYGFHGTSHEYVALQAARILKKPLNKLNLITCHLGNGCSIAAIYKGRSVDTSMGFTPLEGLIMGTRCGDLDAAVVTYIMRKKEFNAHQVDEVLNKNSGLKGISGITNDMRTLFKNMKLGNRRAKLAIEIFIYRIKKYIGAYSAVLGRVDAVIFTAGIGENQQYIREKVCAGIFSSFKKKPKILVIPTNEELMIAHQTYSLIRKRR